MRFFLKIDVEFRDHLNKLKGADLSVFMVIALHMDIERKSFPGIKKISEKSGYDRKTVIKSIRSLIDLDLIERHKRYHKSSVYTVKAYIYPLYESEKIPLSNKNESRELPLSQSEGEIYTRELTPMEDNNTSILKKTTTAAVSKSKYFRNIDRKKLDSLIMDYGLDDVLKTIEMLDDQYENSRKGIDDPQALLETALREKFRPKKGWVSTEERKALKRQEMINTKLKEENEANEKEKMMILDQMFEALSESEHNVLRDRAINELPMVLRKWEPLVKAKMRELLAGAH
jgi:predicted transcriptional regulator